MIKSTIPVVLVLFISLNLFATAQIPDKIIYNGKEYSLHNNPLEHFFEKNPGKRPKDGNESSALWRGYVATFEVIDSQLFLKDIEILVSSSPRKWKTVMSEVFSGQRKPKIDWPTTLLVAPYGELAMQSEL